MKCIELNKGHVTIVDDEDFERIAQYRWTVRKDGYAVRSTKVDGKWKQIYLHHQIIAREPGKLVDHRNTNRLDNRRDNLRMATNAQNATNKSISKNNTTGYKGVFRKRNKYSAQITTNGKVITLGSFATAEQAAAAYAEAAKLHHGDFHRLN